MKTSTVITAFGIGIALSFFIDKGVSKYLNRLTYKISSAKFISFNTVRLAFQIENTNERLPLFLQGLSGSIVNGGTTIATYERQAAINVAPNTSEEVTLDVALNYGGIINNAPQILQNIANNGLLKIKSLLDFGAFKVPYEYNLSVNDLV